MSTNNDIVSAAIAGDVEMIRDILFKREVLPFYIGDIALLSDTCTVDLLQLLADHGYWPSRGSTMLYSSKSDFTSNPYIISSNDPIIQWIKQHYWFPGWF